MEEPEMQLKGKKVTDKFTESIYVLANEPSVALYRLQEHVRRSLPELAQHKADMQRWEEQSQGAIYTVEYACSAVKNLVDSSVYFRSVEGLLKQAISIRDHMNAATQGHRGRTKAPRGQVTQQELASALTCSWTLAGRLPSSPKRGLAPFRAAEIGG
uniref:BLOC-1 related complex subunit 8 n=1 Tax=Equus caballus TaxID=9796 RepID=A0A9L0TLA8_HORSE